MQYGIHITWSAFSWIWEIHAHYYFFVLLFSIYKPTRLTISPFKTEEKRTCLKTPGKSFTQWRLQETNITSYQGITRVACCDVFRGVNKYSVYTIIYTFVITRLIICRLHTSNSLCTALHSKACFLCIYTIIVSCTLCPSKSQYSKRCFSSRV